MIEEQVVTHLAATEGARTWMLSRKFSIGSSKMYRIMIKLEKSGRVKRCERYSACNDMFWVINGDWVRK